MRRLFRYNVRAKTRKAVNRHVGKAIARFRSLVCLDTSHWGIVAVFNQQLRDPALIDLWRVVVKIRRSCNSIPTL